MSTSSLWELFSALHKHAKGLGYVAPEAHELWKRRARELWLELGRRLGVTEKGGSDA